MMKQVFGVLASAALVAASGTAALAHNHEGQHESMDRQSMEQQTIIGEEERMDEVAGVRIVPSVVARDVSLTPSNWMLSAPLSRNASADAKVFTNRQGEITGITIQAMGLPNPEAINHRYSDYVVWLVDKDTNERKNIGTLESRNGGEAVFGYTPETPLRGFDTVVITPEPTFATGWPSGWEQLSGDLPMTAMAMPNEPMMPRRE